MPDDQLDLAAWRADLRGTCPVWELDDFYTSHWDFPTLCSFFDCAACVATPEEMGLGDWVPTPEPDEDYEIPF